MSAYNIKVKVNTNVNLTLIGDNSKVKYLEVTLRSNVDIWSKKNKMFPINIF